MSLFFLGGYKMVKKMKVSHLHVNRIYTLSPEREKLVFEDSWEETEKEVKTKPGVGLVRNGGYSPSHRHRAETNISTTTEKKTRNLLSRIERRKQNLRVQNCPALSEHRVCHSNEMGTATSPNGTTPELSHSWTTQLSLKQLEALNFFNVASVPILFEGRWQEKNILRKKH